jgi:hypothetical protein
MPSATCSFRKNYRREFDSMRVWTSSLLIFNNSGAFRVWFPDFILPTSNSANSKSTGIVLVCSNRILVEFGDLHSVHMWTSPSLMLDNSGFPSHIVHVIHPTSSSSNPPFQRHQSTRVRDALLLVIRYTAPTCHGWMLQFQSGYRVRFLRPCETSICNSTPRPETGCSRLRILCCSYIRSPSASPGFC